MSDELTNGPDEKLRALFASRRGAGETTAACAAPDRIFDAAMGMLAPEESLQLVEHSVSCASCAQAFRLARAVIAEAEAAHIQLGPREPKLAPAILFRPKLRWAVASITGLAAAAALLLFARTPSAPIYRADTVDITSALKPGPLPRDAFVLRWSSLAAGTRYSVNVATPDLNVLFARGGLTSAEVQVPASALAKLPAGGQVVWRVTALLADGRRIESTAFLTAVP